ncbi:uncharacterized protein TNCV_1323621 [Trichonephila clavipes]|nr:uncharacterized protein TNCV_1323621 [Trichonephila clavipes]
MLKLNLDSSLNTIWFHSAAVQSPRARHHFKRRHRWVGVNGNTGNGRRDHKCPSARCLRIVREEPGPLLKVLPVPGWPPLKQVAVSVHFVRGEGLLKTGLSRAS